MNSDAALMVGMILGSAMYFEYLFKKWELLAATFAFWAVWEAWLFGAFK